MRWMLAFVCLFLIVTLQSPVLAETPVNLLTLPSAALEATSLVGDQSRGAAALTDGKRETAAKIDGGGAATVDLVFGFGGGTVAPEGIVLVLSKEKGGVPPARVEVLASTESPKSGFRSLRTDPVNRAKSVQTFAFPPAAARWIMVRLTLAKKSSPISLAEIEILGHPGEPKTNYAFAETPARVIDILARLEKDSVVVLAISADEKKAFEKAKSGRLDPSAFADVALLASGVLDGAKRKHYLDRIDAIAEKAKTAVASAKAPKERGDALLRWLHRAVLKKGYRTTQSDLSVLLDKQTYNCVSSAVLYNIIALKLGIDARAVEVPDHVFSIVYQGTSHMDVETTTADGFSPARDQIKNFERMTGFRYIPDSHRAQRREVTEAGLAALIYYNKSVEHANAKRYHDALLASVRAMSLDSEFVSAAKNALAALANWSFELAKQKKWQQAVDVVTVGVELAPGDAALTNNRHAIWNNWVSSETKAGRFEAAAAALAGALTALPNDPDMANLFGYLGQEWTKKASKPQEWEALADLYARGLKLFPDNAILRQNSAYLVQEWARASAKSGAQSVIPVARKAVASFPELPGVRDALVNAIIQTVNERMSVSDFETSAALVEEVGDILPVAIKGQLLEFSYGKWAESHMAKKEWQEAIDIFDQGLKRVPQSSVLRQNRTYCLAQRGR